MITVVRRMLFGLTFLSISAMADAERMPDPIDFIASITAFAELCAARYPELGDVPSKVEAEGSEHDRKLIGYLKTTPAFESALANARVEVTHLPLERVETECRSQARQDARPKPEVNP